MDQKQVFAVTFESIFLRGMKERLTPQLKDQLRAIDLDLDARLRPAYPLSVYAQALRLAADVGFPELPREQAYRRIGEQSVSSFADTPTGALLLKACATLGPHQVIARAQAQFRTLNNYVTARTRQLGPHHYELWLSDVGERSAYFEGVLGTFLTYSGAKDVTFHSTRVDDEGATYEISWSEPTT